MVDKDFEEFIGVSFDDIDNDKFDPNFKEDDFQWVKKVVEINNIKDETHIYYKKARKNINWGNIAGIFPNVVNLGKNTVTSIGRVKLRYGLIGQNDYIVNFEGDTVVCRIKNDYNEVLNPLNRYELLGKSMVCWDYNIDHEDNESNMAIFYWDNVKNNPSKKSAILYKYLNEENTSRELCAVLHGVDQQTKLSLQMLGKDYDKLCKI